MALNLQLSYQQSNDAVRLRLTDATGDYNISSNPTGWGAPNESVTDVVSVENATSSKYHLKLSITVTLSDNTSVVYDDIDLYSEYNSEFTKTSGMIYDITPDKLTSGGVAMGESDSQLVDGIYQVTYRIAEADTLSTVESTSYVFLVDGVVKQALYAKTADIPTVYNCKILNGDEKDWRELVEVLGIYSIYQGMLSNPSITEINDKLTILGVLQKLLNL